MFILVVFYFRLNDNLPVQADTLPVLSLYFMLCMVFCIVGMVWFTVLNKMKERKNISKLIRYFIAYFLAYFLCSSETRALLKKSLNKIEEANSAQNNENKTEICYVILNRFFFLIFCIFISIINFILLFVMPR